MRAIIRTEEDFPPMFGPVITITEGYMSVCACGCWLREVKPLLLGSIFPKLTLLGTNGSDLRASTIGWRPVQSDESSTRKKKHLYLLHTFNNLERVIFRKFRSNIAILKSYACEG